MNTTKTCTTCDKIVKNAIILFNEKGYDGASISEIAIASGVSKGILYHYFANKDELYLYCVRNFIDTTLAHLNNQKSKDADINSLVLQMVNFGGFFELHPHYEYIFLNMLNSKPTHLSAQLCDFCAEFKENNRKYFARLIDSIDLGAGISTYDVENFIYMIQHTSNPAESTFVSANNQESQLDIIARMIKIFLQGLKSDIK